MALRLHFLFIVLLFASACSSQDSTQVPDAQENHPLSTRTGITEIDSVLAALESGEPQKLSALINYTVAPCTTVDGLGGPPKCREGESEGEQIEALPVIGSEGGFIRKAEMGNWQGIDVHEIYAIYQVAETATVEEYYPAGEYAIVLTAPENSSPIAIRIANGGIVRIDYLMQSSLESLKTVMEREATEVIIAPKLR